MQVIVVEDTGSLLALSAELSTLLPCSPMLSAPWLARWWEHFGCADQGASLFVLSVRDNDGALVGLAPFFVNSSRTIEFLGSGKVCSDHPSILCQEGYEDAVVSEVVDWLFDESAGRTQWQGIDLEAVDSDDTVMQQFVERLRTRSDALVTCREDTGSWYLDLPESWEEYLQGLTKNRRKRCRRWTRNYFESGRAKLRVFSEAEQLEEGFAILEELHNRRRRGVGEAGAFEDPLFRAFHRTVAPEMLAAGMLRLNCLELDGRPIAAEYMLVGTDTLFAYQSGIEPDALDDSPGNLSVMVGIQSAIEEGCRRFDFMRGDETYKANWGALSRPAIRVRAWQRNVGGRLSQLVESARQSSKPVVIGLRSLMP